MTLKYSALIMLALLGTVPAWAADPAKTTTAVPISSTPAPVASKDPALSPAVRAALHELSAEDFQAREVALSNLQVALGQEMRAMVDVNDPEAQARVNDLLTFEEGLCAWVKDVLTRPVDQQKAVLDFGLKPEVLPHVARLYAKETNVRVEAVKALRRNADPRVSDLLAKAIDDKEQQVYVPAMEAVYDRPPTEAVVDALWTRAVAAQFATFKPQVQAVPDRMTFLGKQIQVLNNGDNDLYLRQQDNALATDVLVHMKPPQILPRIRTLLQEVEVAYGRKNPNGNGADEQNVWMYMPSQEAMRNAIRIAGALKPVDMVPQVYRIATGPALQKSSGQLNRQQMYFWSNRTWAIALLLQLTDQSPADWNLRVLNQLQGMWSVPAEADEAAAIVKLRDWWAANHDKYGAGADTRPVVPDDPAPRGRGVRLPVDVVPMIQD